ncbi:FtsX-like permease family protein [Kribbella sp. NPDC003505]|uniref:ABC transporter permease n=1 Tax=Kribbella sp. NPDC003505 TaxID=3154448 RepID=UPI0033AAF31F
MGGVVLVVRLVLADLRRHKAHAAMVVLAVTAASATLALGLSLYNASQSLYVQTRAATAGPDLVVLAPDTGPASTAALSALATEADVVDHNGPYDIVYGTLTAHGFSSSVVVHGASPTPGAVDRPLVTSGGWVRPGGAVLERGFATALGVHVGDRVTVSGRTYPVVGVAVTAATSIYPWSAGIGPLGGPSDYTGLLWLTAPDARALAGRDLTITTALDLKLRDPDATEAFRLAHRELSVRLNFHSWQFIAVQDGHIVQNTQPILVVGGWLLSFLAVAGVAALAAGRAAEQTRRAGLLKAVGATPGQIGVILLTEYLVLALVSEAIGLAVARLAEPAIANPTLSRIGDVLGPTSLTLAACTALALGVALLTTLPPTAQALRTATVAALSSTAQYPRHRPWLTSLSALLPTSLLLGVRLTARRPGRAVLQACSTAVTLTGLTALLTFYAQPVRGYGIASSLPNGRDVVDRRLLLTVTVLLVVLAYVNTVAMTWMTAMEARASMAITRALGATPGQVSAGLSFAQLLPAVPGAVAGAYVGVVLFAFTSRGPTTMPPRWWLLAAVLTTLLATAALTAVPARLAARRSVAHTLSAEAA